MAKHRRRRHRRYGGMVSIPGLGWFAKEGKTKDVAMGAAIGLGGALAAKALSGKYLAGSSMAPPDWVLKGTPLIGAAAAGALSYMFMKKDKRKAQSYAFGAVAAGATMQAWDVLKTTFPESLGDVVSLKFNGARGYGSVFVDEKTPAIGPGGAAYNGLIVDEPGRALSEHNLAQLAGMSVGDHSDSSGLEELMDME